MDRPAGLDEKGWQYLKQLYEVTGDDYSRQVSMYEVGNALGWEKDESARVAEALIGSQLVNIVTLSGGIGISPDGVAAVKEIFGRALNNQGQIQRLTRKPIIDEAGKEILQTVTGEIRCLTGKLNLDFEPLNELMADLKTIDAQLQSSRPKSAVIRECLLSMTGVLESADDRQHVNKIRMLLGES